MTTGHSPDFDESTGAFLESEALAASPALPPSLGGFSWRKIAHGKEMWALVDQGLVSGTNFLSYVLLARVLGMREFGVFTLAWMAVLLANSLHSAIIVSPMMSVGPKQSAESRPLYYGAVAAHEFILATVSYGCVYFATIASSVWFPSWGIHTLATPLALATATYLGQDFTRRYFFTIRRSGLALVSDAVSGLTQLLILGWLAFYHQLSSASVLWTMALTSLLAIVVSIFWMTTFRFSPSMIRPVARRHWPVARWLAASAALQWSSQNLFVVSAPIFYGPAAAGALRACQNLVAVSHIWILGLENVLPVEAARQLHEHGPGALLQYIRAMLVRWGLITAAVMFMIGVIPSFWLHLVYGPQYSVYGYVLRLYGVFYITIFIGAPLRAGLQALEFTAPIMWAYCAMTVFAILTATPLARRFGLPGVMSGSIGAQLLFELILISALVTRSRRMRLASH